MGRPHRAFRPSTCVALALLLLVGVGCFGPGGGRPHHWPPGGERRGTFDLLTYNVAGLPQEISTENPAVNIPKISPLLNAYDLVLTQEDFDWWVPGGVADGLDFNQYHERLRAETDHEFATPVHPGPEAAGIDLADRPLMLVGDGIGMLSRFPLADFETRAWTGCFGGYTNGASDCLAMKGFRAATMELGGAEVDVYSLHAEAGGGDEDQALQAADFAQLAAFITEHSAGRAIVLGGDTNLHLDRPDDPQDAADPGIWSDFLAATGLTDVCDATQCDDPGIIDKVAIRDGAGIRLRADAHAVPVERFSDEAGVPLSDHSPVVATISWTRDPRGPHRPPHRRG